MSLLRSSFEPARRAVCVASEGVSVFHWERGGVTDTFVFDADDAGLANFDRYLAETAKSPVYLMVDIVEEEYRHETVPHLYGAERRAVIERKQAWLFRGTPYGHVILQGRMPEGRRDDRVLLTAIINPDLVTPWVRLCHQNRVPLAGIYSLPILSSLLLNRMRVGRADVLLVTIQSLSGLRQSYFKDRGLKISRLAKMPRLGTVPFAPYIVAEVERFERYLKSVNLVAEAPIDTYILLHGDLLDQVEAHCRDTEAVHYHLLDVAEVARRLGIHGVLTTPFSDHIFAHLLLKSTPQNHYAQREERRFYTMHRARWMLLAASIVALFGGSIWSGLNGIQGWSLRQLAREAEDKANFYESRYRVARGRLPPTPVGPAEIEAAVDIVDTLAGYRTAPEAMMETVSRALAGFPELQLDELRWRASVDPNAGLEEAGSTGGSPPDHVSPVPGGAYFEIARIGGKVTAFDGDYRAAFELINRFAGALRRQPRVHAVEVLKLPIDVRSDARIQGDSAEAEGPGEAKFAVKVVMGAGHAAS